MTEKLKGITSAVVAPIAIAIYPSLFLLSRNTDQIEFEQVTRSIVLSLLLMADALAAALIFTKDWTKSALLATGGLILFFSYGHAYEFLKLAVNPLARHRYLLPIWGLLLAGWVYLVLQIWGQRDISARMANIVAIGLLLFR